LSTDLRSALRRLKPEKRHAQIRPRPPSALIAAEDVGAIRHALVLDTNVYIMDVAGRLPEAVRALLKRSLVFHCSVCLGELAVGVANLDPGHRRAASIRDHYAAAFDAVPASRLLTPDDQVWVDAGLAAGTLARIQGWDRRQLKESLNDCLIYLTAAKAGLPVLTADRDDFDLIQQISPGGRFVHF
jgi:predicted nucleic acid-binding protein